MRWFIGVLAVAAIAAVVLGDSAVGAQAQQSEATPKKAAAAKIKAEPGMKTCNYKFPDGERRTWTCRKEEPCCAWDAIKYVKCGSTVTNCL